MKITEIKNKITTQSSSSLSRLIADNWVTAQSGLWSITDDTYREIPVSQYPLQILCLMARNKDGFHDRTSAEKEKIVERMKAVLEPVKQLLDDRTDMMLPSYSTVSNFTPQDDETESFNEQLKEDFKRMEEQSEADALALTLYAVVYAYCRNFDDDITEQFLRFYVEDPYDNEATQDTYGTQQTNAPVSYASSASGSSYRYRKAPGKWLLLKVYLIATTLFVALVFSLVFLSMSTGVGASSMSIMDISGQMVNVEPGMEPITLFLFGTVNYDELIVGIKNVAITFVIWRVMLIIAVYIINAHRRQSCRP